MFAFVNIMHERRKKEEKSITIIWFQAIVLFSSSISTLVYLIRLPSFPPHTNPHHSLSAHRRSLHCNRMDFLGGPTLMFDSSSIFSSCCNINTEHCPLLQCKGPTSCFLLKKGTQYFFCSPGAYTEKVL